MFELLLSSLLIAVEIEQPITLYDDINLRGDSVQIKHKGEGCINLNTPQYDFDGRTSSIDLADHCVKLYQRPDCKGIELKLTHINTEKNETRVLDTLDWDNEASSLRCCNDYCAIHCGYA